MLRLGIGSECVQAGNPVWIVPGSRVPLLLRSVQYDEPQAVQPRTIGVPGGYCDDNRRDSRDDGNIYT
ncbi:hypothetical protein N657DRAFT_645544 [Parathielavia appendiculata]|uniref:Uncharacterized protein n=1 Tax=Parathielavia appendiculata TaxID=2587402 RepID=A0AAN6U0B9_9PEZI|nr:hypothetical protein N657DRAFT_645544 [Parathielavia appendiculata]